MNQSKREKDCGVLEYCCPIKSREKQKPKRAEAKRRKGFGKELVINKGKTWVGIVPTAQRSNFSITES